MPVWLLYFALCHRQQKLNISKMVACLKTYIILSITVTKGHSGLSVSFESNIQSFNMLAKMVCLNFANCWISNVIEHFGIQPQCRCSVYPVNREIDWHGAGLPIQKPPLQNPQGCLTTDFYLADPFFRCFCHLWFVHWTLNVSLHSVAHWCSITGLQVC